MRRHVGVRYLYRRSKMYLSILNSSNCPTRGARIKTVRGGGEGQSISAVVAGED